MKSPRSRRDIREVLPIPKVNPEASPAPGGKIFYESRFATERPSKISGLSDGRSESVKQPKY